MKVSEEIEALQVMAINPIRFLIVPRFLAMLIMLPALTIFGDYVGMVGGWSICHFALDYNTSAYIYRSVTHAHPWDLYSGLIKSFVFAWLVITIACHMGLRVEGGARRGPGDHGIGRLVAAHHAHRQRLANRAVFLHMSAGIDSIPVIEVTDLVRDFHGRKVLNGITFKVMKGDTMIIMGGSGCGKSTLLRHIIGAMKPTSGSIKLFGEEITGLEEKDLSHIRRRFGVLFQSSAASRSR